jgi:hypothetical protein
MAKKRMFNLVIVESDEFLDMPLSSQALYFHLSMAADDYGFISPKRVMRMIGANEDDLKLLIYKRYVLQFESGVVVIKHWQVNNTIRKDRSNPTTYSKELKTLTFNEFGAYTEISRIGRTAQIISSASTVHRHDIDMTSTSENVVDEVYTTIPHETTGVADIMSTNGQPNDNQTETQNRIDKNRIDKRNTVNSITTDLQHSSSPNKKSLERVPTEEITELLEYWESKLDMKLGNENGNRKAIASLIRQHGKDSLKRLVDGVLLAQEDQYAPRISDFVSLKRKQNDLLVWGRKRNGKKSTVAQI